jgi:hypothetical protein
MTKLARTDVQPVTGDEFEWTAEYSRQSTLKSLKRAEAHALNAMEWYLGAKRSRRERALPDIDCVGQCPGLPIPPDRRENIYGSCDR